MLSMAVSAEGKLDTVMDNFPVDCLVIRRDFSCCWCLSLAFLAVRCFSVWAFLLLMVVFEDRGDIFLLDYAGFLGCLFPVISGLFSGVQLLVLPGASFSMRLCFMVLESAFSVLMCCF